MKATLRAAPSGGRTAANLKTKGWVLGATIPVGPGDVKLGYGRAEVGAATTASRVGVGHDYPLSKRARTYADVARDSKVTTPVGHPRKTGCDLGISHNF